MSLWQGQTFFFTFGEESLVEYIDTTMFGGVLEQFGDETLLYYDSVGHGASFKAHKNSVEVAKSEVLMILVQSNHLK